MPHLGMLGLSLIAMMIGMMYILFPSMLLGASMLLSRLTGHPVDQRMIRYRHLIGVLWFMFSYGLFKVSMMFALDPLHLLIPFA